MINIDKVILAAEKILPGAPVKDNEQDPRWQAIIKIGKYVRSQPEKIWQFTAKWGKHRNEDLRMAVATCLLEHLLQFHFDLIFPKVRYLVFRNRFFADTFTLCGKFGQTKKADNLKRFHDLKKKCYAKYLHISR